MPLYELHHLAPVGPDFTALCNSCDATMTAENSHTLESKLNRRSRLRLFAACCGVGDFDSVRIKRSNTTAEVCISVPASLVALFAIFGRAVYAVEVSRTQREREIGSIRMLELQMPLTSLLALSSSPQVDVWPDVRGVSPKILAAIAAARIQLTLEQQALEASSCEQTICSPRKADRQVLPELASPLMELVVDTSHR